MAFVLRFILLLTLLGSWRSQANAWFNSMLQQENWQHYQNCLLQFQKKRPGVFPALEWIRFDLLPYQELQHQVNKYGNLWRQSHSAAQKASGNTQELELSKNANRDLYELYKKQMKSKGAQLVGSSRAILKSIADSNRFSLTPFDELFQSTEAGKNVKTLLDSYGSKQWEAFSLNEDQKLLFFEGVDQRLYDSVKISQKKSSDGSVILKLESKSNNRKNPSVNVQFRPDFLNGSFYGYEKISPHPFGPYVRASDTFHDEKGQSHFGGDGHDHQH